MKMLFLGLLLVGLLTCTPPNAGIRPIHIEIGPAPADPQQTLPEGESNAHATKHRLYFFTVTRTGYDALTVTENTALYEGQYCLAPSVVTTLLKSDTSRVVSVEVPLYSAERHIKVLQERPYKSILLLPVQGENSPYLYKNTYHFTADSAGASKTIVLEVFSDEALKDYRYGF